MLTAVITVVIDDKEGIYEQDVVEAKTENALNAKLKRILFDYIKSFHVDNGYLEEESDEYCKSIAGDIVEDREVYSPSCYAGSGFVQVKFF